jgi:hypothetical protein
MFIAKQIVETIGDRCRRPEKWQHLLQVFAVPNWALPHEIGDHVMATLFAAAIEVVTLEKAIDAANDPQHVVYMRSCRVSSLREAHAIAYRHYANLVRVLRPFRAELEILLDVPTDPAELVRRQSAQSKIAAVA